MKELFYEIIKEAYDANIVIDNEVWNIGFNTIIKEKNIEYYNDKKNVYTLVIKTNCSQQLYHIINTNGGD